MIEALRSSLALTDRRQLVYTPQLKDIQPFAEDLYVFDIRLYRHRLEQALENGLSEDEAKEVVEAAIVNDGVGLVTENISGLKKEGKYLLDDEYRIRMQLTPPVHYYKEEIVDGQKLMVAPEDSWRGFHKDIVEGISDWRRGLDKAAMRRVKSVFLNEEDDQPLQEGEVLFWCSPQAEKWEGEGIVKYNGHYGFLYMGKVASVDGAKVLEVHDFKTDLDASTYREFLAEAGEKVNEDPTRQDHPLVDRVKTMVARTKQSWDDERVWSKLSEVKLKTTGDEEIFGLPVEAILALQDPQLHQRVKEEVAKPIANWMVGEIYSGTPAEVIQGQVKERYIQATLSLVAKIKQQRSSRLDRVLNTKYHVVNPGHIQAAEGRRYQGSLDPEVLARYSGSNGDGCGTWGETPSLSKVSSVLVGSEVMRVGKAIIIGDLMIDGPRVTRGRACASCGTVNFCTEVCWICKGFLVSFNPSKN